MEIKKGDIFYIRDDESSQGSEQESGRPAIIVSNNKCNTHSNVIEVVYLTTKEKKPLPTHVPIICKVPSTALCEQVHSVSIYRLNEFVRTVSDEEMKQINKALIISLALEDDSEAEADSYEKQAMEAHIEYLEKELADASEDKERMLFDLAQLEKAAVENKPDMKIASLEAERNTYKDMYENLLHKLLEK